jgi:hypothetical protein
MAYVIGVQLFGREAVIRDDGTMFVPAEPQLDTRLPFEEQLAYLRSIDDPLAAELEGNA